MLRTAFKQNIKNPLNLLWLIAPVAWYMGTGTTRQNIEFISNAAQTNEAFRQQLAAINGYTVFIEGASDFYLPVLLVLLGGIIYSSSFAYDKNTGYGNYCITRSTFGKYYFSKTFSTFICSFMFAFISLFGIFCYSLIKYSAVYPTAGFNLLMVNEDIKALFYTNPLFIVFSIIFTLCIFTAIYTTIGIGISVFFSNRLIISVSPLAVYLLCTMIPQFFNIQSPAAKILAWIFPSYFTGFFIANDFFYCKLPIWGIYPIHILILCVPALVFLTLLYRKNTKQYIR